MKSLLLVLLLSPAVLGSSEPQREEQLFEKADLNHDGSLTRSDLHQVFLDFDNDHDAVITESEFVADWRDIFHLGNGQEASLLFHRADVNGDGVLTVADLPSVFAFFDTNANNLVDRNEFLTQWADLRLDVPGEVTFKLETSTGASA